MLGVGREGPLGERVADDGDGGHARLQALGRVADEPPAGAYGRGPSTGGASDAHGGRDGLDVDGEHLAWAVLASVEGLGPVGLMALVAQCGDARCVVDMARRRDGPARIARVAGSRPGAVALAERIAAAARGEDSIARALEAARVRVVTLDDDPYPASLARVELPPPVLFVRGAMAAMSTARRVAIVGTRRPTDAGRSHAARMAGAVARTGAAVVSGLAVGIDGVAHAAAVAVGGTTVAVIGGGHARGIPRGHAHLAEAIVAGGGAIVSEHAPETHPTRGTFPRRNRVISGLTEATVVVEAGVRSGALITAGWALEQGRECFVVPGPVDAPASAGCLALLRTYGGQVRVVAGVAELIEDLGLADTGSDPGHRDRTPVHPGGARSLSGGAPPATLGALSHAAVLAGLPAGVADVARALTAGPRTADQVVAACRLPIAAVLAAMTLLEDRGLVAGGYGRYHLAGALVDLAS